MLHLDHIAVLAETLDEAALHCETALGTPLAGGGSHAMFGTHNRLLGLGHGHYLEAIAVDPSAPAPGRARWFGLDSFAGPARLDKWVCRVPDMVAALAALPEAGEPVTVERGNLRWIMAVPPDGLLPWDGLFPALIEWQSPVPPGMSMPGEGRRIQGLQVSHPLADRLERRLAPFLSAPVRFVCADTPALRAQIETPYGVKDLT
ncbi:MAG: VOC family protein [Roseivivax sp.]|nr:VOC family protein [Roseivivax sp.]